MEPKGKELQERLISGTKTFSSPAIQGFEMHVFNKLYKFYFHLLSNIIHQGERSWPVPPRYLDTIAEGCRLQWVGDNTFPILYDMAEKEVFPIVSLIHFAMERLSTLFFLKFTLLQVKTKQKIKPCHLWFFLLS